MGYYLIKAIRDAIVQEDFTTVCLRSLTSTVVVSLLLSRATNRFFTELIEKDPPALMTDVERVRLPVSWIKELPHGLSWRIPATFLIRSLVA